MTTVRATQVFEDSSNVILVEVPCDSTVYVNAAVRMESTGIAYNALADSIANSNVIGIVISKSSATVCTIRVTGVTNDIFTGLDVTKEYYLSDTIAGEITTTVPSTSGHVRLKLGQPYSDSQFLIMKGERTTRA
jgi:hypothetical protein